MEGGGRRWKEVEGDGRRWKEVPPMEGSGQQGRKRTGRDERALDLDGESRGLGLGSRLLQAVLCVCVDARAGDISYGTRLTDSRTCPRVSGLVVGCYWLPPPV